MLGDFVEAVRKAAFDAASLQKRKVLPQGLCYGFGLGFAGEGCEIGSQFRGFGCSMPCFITG